MENKGEPLDKTFSTTLFFVRRLGADEAQRTGAAYAVDLLDDAARTVYKVFFSVRMLR
jgi:hypothetical protein